MAKGNIFISYRQGVDSNAAGRLHDRLERTFDEGQLFFDVDAIPLGQDFGVYIDHKVGECDALLAVIGQGWLQTMERLGDAQDFVRIEVEAALSRPDIPVIPVLIDGAEMPSAEALPETMRPLVRRNAVRIRHSQFSAIVDGKVTEALEAAVAQGVARRERNSVRMMDELIKEPIDKPRETAFRQGPDKDNAMLSPDTIRIQMSPSSQADIPVDDQVLLPEPILQDRPKENETAERDVTHRQWRLSFSQIFFSGMFALTFMLWILSSQDGAPEPKRFVEALEGTFCDVSANTASYSLTQTLSRDECRDFCENRDSLCMAATYHFSGRCTIHQGEAVLLDPSPLTEAGICYVFE